MKSEGRFQHLKAWVEFVNDAASRGDPPDTQSGCEAFAALRAVIRWCEGRLDSEALREMAIAVDSAMGVTS